MRIGVVRKSAADRLDYDVSFAEWLTKDDEIIEAEASIENNTEADPLVIESAAVFNEHRKVKLWMNGGERGTSYNVNLFVTTAQGRVKKNCFQVRVTGC
jgi:hypothetical protein